MNSEGDALHPNWRALATIHLPLKRFIKAGENSENAGVTDADGLKYEITGVSGAEVKDFYEQLVTTESNKTAIRTTQLRKLTAAKPKRHISRKTPQPQRFDAKKFFICAQTNDADSLSNFNINNEQINTTDQFGWTALMIAACEGAKAAVEVLLSLGADKDIKDKSGKTALMLAQRKGHLDIVELLENAESLQSKIEPTNNTAIETVDATNPFYCSLCKLNFTETTLKAHQTSTVHQFNLKSTMPSNKLTRFNISQKNRGLQMMVKQGWDKESGLGPSQSGRLYPIKTVIRKQRTGLGIEQQAARVTHFDVKPHRSEYYKNKPRNRNDIRREKIRDWKREKRLRRELS